jgi:rubrerythrin
MKYLSFAEQAEKDGKPKIANLFRAIAHAERVHATAHLKALGKVGSTLDNLGAAKGGEDYEVDEMYPAFMAVATLQGEKQAERSMHFAIEAEKIHAQLYAAARKAVEAGEDLSAARVWVCPVCGFTALGDAPEKCPVCNALQKVFKEFAA